MENSELPVDAEALAEVGPYLDLADVMELLSDDLARYTVVALFDRSTISLAELAEIAVGFRAAERDSISGPADLERVRIRLHHATLPKLESMGYVEYDSEAGTITHGDVPEGVYTLLGLGS